MNDPKGKLLNDQRKIKIGLTDFVHPLQIWRQIQNTLTAHYSARFEMDKQNLLDQFSFSVGHSRACL